MRIKINRCNKGLYVRYFMNGWHHFQFNPTESEKVGTVLGTQTKERFSIISKVEEATGVGVKTFYTLGVEGISGKIFEGLKGIIYAEEVRAFLNGRWALIKIDKDSFTVRNTSIDAYTLIMRAELIDVGVLVEDKDNTLPPKIIYFEPFNSSDEMPFGFTIETNNATVSKATISGDDTLRFAIDKYAALPYDEANLGIITLELPNYADNYGTIRTTIIASIIALAKAPTYQELSGHTVMRLDLSTGANIVESGGDALNGVYLEKKKIYIQTKNVPKDKPVRFVRLSIQYIPLAPEYNMDVNAYLDSIKIERI